MSGLGRVLAQQEAAILDAQIGQLSECKFLSEADVVELAAKCKVRAAGLRFADRPAWNGQLQQPLQLHVREHVGPSSMPAFPLCKWQQGRLRQLLRALAVGLAG